MRTVSHPVLSVRISRHVVMRAGWLIVAAIYGMAAGHVAAGNPIAFSVLAFVGGSALTAILIGVQS